MSQLEVLHEYGRVLRAGKSAYEFQGKSDSRTISAPSDWLRQLSKSHAKRMGLNKYGRALVYFLHVRKQFSSVSEERTTGPIADYKRA
ncbi:hypothetical protein VCV18_011169 [Metarhizium anisopliae]